MIEENPNCSPDERVFSNSGEKRNVRKVLLNPPFTNSPTWCDISAVSDQGEFTRASAQKVEDSSDGTAWLVFGGAWGLRLRVSSSETSWSFTEPHQWGVPFLVMDGSGADIEFE